MAEWTRATLLKRIATVIEDEWDLNIFDSDTDAADEARSKLASFTVFDLIEAIERQIVREAMRRRVR